MFRKVEEGVEIFDTIWDKVQVNVLINITYCL